VGTEKKAEKEGAQRRWDAERIAFVEQEETASTEGLAIDLSGEGHRRQRPARCEVAVPATCVSVLSVASCRRKTIAPPSIEQAPRLGVWGARSVWGIHTEARGHGGTRFQEGNCHWPAFPDPPCSQELRGEFRLA